MRPVQFSCENRHTLYFLYLPWLNQTLSDDTSEMDNNTNTSNYNNNVAGAGAGAGERNAFLEKMVDRVLRLSMKLYSHSLKDATWHVSITCLVFYVRLTIAQNVYCNAV